MASICTEKYTYMPCTSVQKNVFYVHHPDPTSIDDRARLARLGLRLLVGLEPGTRVIGVLLLYSSVLNRGAWLTHTATGDYSLFGIHTDQNARSAVCMIQYNKERGKGCNSTSTTLLAPASVHQLLTFSPNIPTMPARMSISL